MSEMRYESEECNKQEYSLYILDYRNEHAECACRVNKSIAWFLFIVMFKSYTSKKKCNAYNEATKIRSSLILIKLLHLRMCLRLFTFLEGRMKGRGRRKYVKLLPAPLPPPPLLGGNANDKQWSEHLTTTLPTFLYISLSYLFISVCAFFILLSPRYSGHFSVLLYLKLISDIRVHCTSTRTIETKYMKTYTSYTTYSFSLYKEYLLLIIRTNI